MARPRMRLVLSLFVAVVMFSAVASAQPIGSILRPNQIMSQRQYLVSPNGYFFLILQDDGNLAQYRGRGPENMGALWWSTNKTVSEGPAFAMLYAVGNLVVNKGTGMMDNHGVVWATPGVNPVGQYVLSLQDDGNLVIFKGSDPVQNQGILWQTGKRITVPLLGTRMTTLTPLRDGQQIGIESRACECLKGDNSGWTLTSGGAYAVTFPHYAATRSLGTLQFNDLLTVEVVPRVSGDTIFYTAFNGYQKLRLRTSTGGYLRFNQPPAGSMDASGMRADATQATADIFIINVIWYDTGLGLVPNGYLVGARDKVLVTSGGYCGAVAAPPGVSLPPGPTMQLPHDDKNTTSRFFNIWVMP